MSGKAVTPMMPACINRDQGQGHVHGQKEFSLPPSHAYSHMSHVLPLTHTYSRTLLKPTSAVRTGLPA